jgi:hypothetical protein
LPALFELLESALQHSDVFLTRLGALREFCLLATELSFACLLFKISCLFPCVLPRPLDSFECQQLFCLYSVALLGMTLQLGCGLGMGGVVQLAELLPRWSRLLFLQQRRKILVRRVLVLASRPEPCAGNELAMM